MKIIKPNKLSLLNSSSSSDSVWCATPSAEDDTTDGVTWNSSTTYAFGTLVRKNHVTYKSMIDGNTGNNPESTFGGDDPSWMVVGATNPYKMLDDYLETVTKAPVGKKLVFKVPFVNSNSFALLNIGGATCRVRIEESDGTVNYDETLDLIEDIPSISLYDYYFHIINSNDTNVKTDVPVTLNGTMTVTITPVTNQHNAYVGHVIAGMTQYIGETMYSAEIGITDYSKKVRDDFGVTTLIKRSQNKTASVSLYIPPQRVNLVARLLTELRATPIVVEGGNRDDGEEALSIYGWIEDWHCVYEGPNQTEFRLEIQGLI